MKKSQRHVRNFHFGPKRAWIYVSGQEELMEHSFNWKPVNHCWQVVNETFTSIMLIFVQVRLF